MKNIAITVLSFCLLACNTDQKNKTKFTFTLKNYPREIVKLDEYSDTASLKVKKGITAKKDANGVYKVELDLKIPKYYRVGRNFVYLSPGDSLVADLDTQDSYLGKYSGNNAAENTYLNSTPYPKAGSFLGERLAGKPVLTSSLKESVENIKKAAKEREEKLKNTKGLTKEFVALEQARIKADIINSYESLKVYFGYVNKIPEIKNDSLRKEIDLLTEKEVKRLSKDFINTSYLQLATYQQISELIIKHNETSPKLQKIKDWKSVMNTFYKMMKLSSNDEITALYEKTEPTLKTPKYKKSLEDLHTDYTRFGDGSAADNFNAVDVNGNNVKLEDFKGKVIYIDMWATWCVPCLNEMPHFNKLAEKYADKDIVFISLSIDNNLNAWKENLKTREHNGLQLNISRLNLSAYKVTGVPRIVIIDKEFKMAKYNAPEPSDPKTEKIIEDLLSK